MRFGEYPCLYQRGVSSGQVFRLFGNGASNPVDPWISFTIISQCLSRLPRFLGLRNVREETLVRWNHVATAHDFFVCVFGPPIGSFFRPRLVRPLALLWSDFYSSRRCSTWHERHLQHTCRRRTLDSEAGWGDSQAEPLTGRRLILPFLEIRNEMTCVFSGFDMLTSSVAPMPNSNPKMYLLAWQQFSFFCIIHHVCPVMKPTRRQGHGVRSQRNRTQDHELGLYRQSSCCGAVQCTTWALTPPTDRPSVVYHGKGQHSTIHYYSLCKIPPRKIDPSCPRIAESIARKWVQEDWPLRSEHYGPSFIGLLSGDQTKLRDSSNCK
jgi:hypothetical protein